MEALGTAKYLSELWNQKMFAKSQRTYESGLVWGVCLKKKRNHKTLSLGQSSFKHFQSEQGNFKQKCNYPARICACLSCLFSSDFQICSKLQTLKISMSLANPDPASQSRFYCSSKYLLLWQICSSFLGPLLGEIKDQAAFLLWSM